MTRVGDDTACVPTQSDLIDALAGRCQVSVLLVDSIPAVRLVSTESDDEEAVLGLASPDGSAWRYATGQTEALRRGEYELPSSNGEPQSAVTLRLAAMAGINLPKGLGLLRVVVGAVSQLGIAAATNQAICCMQPSENVIPDYLIAFIQQYTPTLLLRRVGGAQPNLSQELLRSIQLPVPPIEIQRTFSARKKLVEKFSQRLEESLACLDALFASLQHRAFRGEL